MADRYIELFIKSLEEGEIEDALNILAEIPDNLLSNDFAEYHYRRILYRGPVITNFYTERHFRQLIRDNNLVYHILKSKDVEIIKAFIERIAEMTDFEDEFSVDMFSEDLLSFVASSLMYGIVWKECFCIIVRCIWTNFG
jgi:hypothetical protein